VVSLLTVLLSACSESRVVGPNAPDPSEIVIGTLRAKAKEPIFLVGAGDIAGCTSKGKPKPGALATALLLDSIPGTVMAVGDEAYPDGTTADFTNCYHPSWGRHKWRTMPAVGNHEYNADPTAAPYFKYFGSLAAPPFGYYSYDLGTWHIVVLNSNKAFVSTAVGSQQERWLRVDLARTDKKCVLAYWHHPRFRSSVDSTKDPPGPQKDSKAFWDALYAANADVVVNGHQHFYERYAPQTPDGVFDTLRGIRQFIVGTGGAGASWPRAIPPNSEVRNGDTFGVIKFTLDSASYTWEFIPVAGQTFTDSGSGKCH
jgi:hypothetical protein